MPPLPPPPTTSTSAAVAWLNWIVVALPAVLKLCTLYPATSAVAAAVVVTAPGSRLPVTHPPYVQAAALVPPALL